MFFDTVLDNFLFYAINIDIYSAIQECSWSFVFTLYMQLKQSKLEKTELDASFKNQSIKFEEIVKEMKLSRYLDECLHCFSSH